MMSCRPQNLLFTGTSKQEEGSCRCCVEIVAFSSFFHRSSSSWKRLGANSLSGNGRAVVSRRNPGEGAALAETTNCFEGELQVFPVAALAVDVESPSFSAAMGLLKSFSTDRRKLLLSEVLTDAVGCPGLGTPRWGVPGSAMANAE